MNQLIRSNSLRASQSQRQGDPRRGLVCTTRAGPTVSRSRRAKVPANLFRVDLLDAGALFVACDLALGGASLRDREPLRRPEFLGHRAYPFGELLEPRPSGDRLTALEVDELSGEPVPDRPPQVLLEQAVREVRERLALVEGARDPRRQRITESRERARLAEVGLRVADPDLDRREGEVRPHAPPDLRVLGDRAGAVEKAHEGLVLAPRREGIWDAAT